MDTKKSALERAFDLARSGICEDVGIIKKRLDYEGYASGQVQGPALTKQLNVLIAAARK